MPDPQISLFGIRHHGPGSARSLRQALEALRPDCVLIEGPPDADPILPLAAHAEMHPPVALLLYAPDAPHKAAYYPFAEFSPEWQAIRYALQNKIPVRFMDLPQAIQLAESKERVIVSTSGDPDAPAETSLSASTLDLPGDPLSWVAGALGYSDSERWWEQLVEQRQDSRDLFAGILELMQAVRAEWEQTAFPLTPGEALREAHMRSALRAAQAEGHPKIAAVCGAWHTSALALLDQAHNDEKLLQKLPRVAVAATWVPWTYDRLALRSGYGAGVESPGWYEHLWRSRRNLIESWLVHVARLFRSEDLSVSPAHVIEAGRLAEALAALRSHPVPGLPEINDAALAVFCNGDETPMRLIHERLIVGIRLGKVPAETPTVPLQRDLSAAQKRTRLEPSASPEVLDLDLRKPLLLERSQLLHCLNLLGIPWGRLQGGRSGRGTFHEIWGVEWKPEFAIAVIEASLWGNTLVEAATRKTQALAQEADLPGLTRLVEAALLANLPEAIHGLLERVQHTAAVSSDMLHLMGALPPLANVLRYGNVRQTSAGMVGQVVNELAERICVGLPAACSTLDDAAAQEMFEHIQAVHQALALIENDALAQDWLHTLDSLAAPHGGHGLVRGLAARLLYDRQVGDDTATRMSLALSPGEDSSQAAAWVQGFLQNGGAALIHDARLWRILDDWLLALNQETFVILLPLLRRTFSTFPAPERRQIGEMARRGGVAQILSGEMDLDLSRARKVLPLLVKILAHPQPDGDKDV